MTLVFHASTDRHAMWNGPKRYLRIVVHDNLEKFRAAAEKFSPHMDWDHAAGAFHPSQKREKWEPLLQRWVPTSSPHYAGIIRLSLSHTEVEVVAHEVTHAAAHIYRENVDESGSLGDNCGEAEERFAYILGDLVASVTNAMHFRGVWTL